VFRQKCVAGISVINGFGKSAGLSQVEELGRLETPILLTNTLSVGQALDALVEYMCIQNPEIGISTTTVNGVVGECNDGHLNDIQGRHVKREHVFSAIQSAMPGRVEEGVVGAGTGMSCFGLKGGIGTASRTIAGPACAYHLGALVLANFGLVENLFIGGVHVGRELASLGYGLAPPEPPRPTAGTAGDDGGSIIMVLATDAPLESRQVKRVARRAAFGLSRTGSFGSHGSGDYVFAFSTANTLDHFGDPSALRHEALMRDDDPILNRLFQAAADTVEESILNALFAAETTTGRDNNTRQALPLDVVEDMLMRHGRLSR
jgi:D-aminopeptidase